MKKIVIFLLVSTTLLTSCISQRESNTGDISNKSHKETIQNINNADDKNYPTQSTQDEDDKNNISPETTKVKGKVQLYEGSYRDARCYITQPMLKSYNEVIISNVTDTSFDFTSYQVVDAEKGEKKIIFHKNTAIFIGDGTIAAFYGKDYTLNFTFPNYHLALPAVTDIEISGFDPLEGNTYVNNGIPGHEFS